MLLDFTIHRMRVTQRAMRPLCYRCMTCALCIFCVIECSVIRTSNQLLLQWRIASVEAINIDCRTFITTSTAAMATSMMPCAYSQGSGKRMSLRVEGSSSDGYSTAVLYDHEPAVRRRLELSAVFHNGERSLEDGIDSWRASTWSGDETRIHLASTAYLQNTIATVHIDILYEVIASDTCSGGKQEFFSPCKNRRTSQEVYPEGRVKRCTFLERPSYVFGFNYQINFALTPEHGEDGCFGCRDLGSRCWNHQADASMGRFSASLPVNTQFSELRLG